jgi:hypothetical protein
MIFFKVIFLSLDSSFKRDLISIASLIKFHPVALYLLRCAHSSGANAVYYYQGKVRKKKERQSSLSYLEAAKRLFCYCCFSAFTHIQVF